MAWERGCIDCCHPLHITPQWNKGRPVELPVKLYTTCIQTLHMHLDLPIILWPLMPMGARVYLGNLDTILWPIGLQKYYNHLHTCGCCFCLSLCAVCAAISEKRAPILFMANKMDKRDALSAVAVRPPPLFSYLLIIKHGKLVFIVFLLSLFPHMQCSRLLELEKITDRSYHIW